MNRTGEEALVVKVEQECHLAVPEYDLSAPSTISIPLSNLSALGVAFQPLTSAIQTITSGAGGSGLYYVNTNGKQMFTSGTEYIGSLMTENGAVGGGQARMTAFPCDPTMLFMAAALMNIEKKLDSIQEMQTEILAFLEEKERAVLQGNLNTLNDVLSNFKYNWTNETYKTNKHILVQQIKKEAESSIVLYREQIVKKAKKRSLIHSDQEVKSKLSALQSCFKDYQLALYLYSFASFLEIMLLGNYDEGYLNSIENRIREYSLQYRTLYGDCYTVMEGYAKSSIQSGVMSGLAVASKFVGETIAKIPVVSNSQLDESLIEAGAKLHESGDRRTDNTLSALVQISDNVTVFFVNNIIYNNVF